MTVAVSCNWSRIKPLPVLVPPSCHDGAHFAGMSCRITADAPVAQLDRVAASEAAGRWFESSRARHTDPATPAHRLSS